MLGFTTLSETPLSQATTSAEALGFLSTTLVSTNPGTLAYQAIANITPPAATASGLASSFDDVDAQASTNVTSVLSNFDINGIAQVIGESSVTPSAVLANFTASGLDFNARANITTPNVIASASLNDPDKIDAASNVTLSPTSAFLTIYITDFSDEDAQATALLSPVVGETRVNTEVPTAETFDYAQFADTYNRSRVLYILGFDDNRTVHISPVNNTVYIDTDIQNYTVYIAE